MGALNGVTIRPAEQADLAALHALIESAYRGDRAWQGWTHEANILGGPRIAGDELAALIDDSGRAMLIAEEDGAIVGSVEIADRGGALAYLGLLSVDPARQGGGLGRRLVGAAEQAARDRFGATRMEMTVIAERTELIAWYERIGYCRTGEVRPFPYDGDELVFMRGVPPHMVVFERTIVAPCDEHR